MCEVLHGQQGHVFVCGDVRMARDVAQALRALLARALRLSQQQAEEYFQQLKVAQSQPSPCIHRRQARLLCLGDRAQRLRGSRLVPWGCQHSFCSLGVTEGLCCSALTGGPGDQLCRVLGASGAAGFIAPSGAAAF